MISGRPVGGEVEGAKTRTALDEVTGELLDTYEYIASICHTTCKLAAAKSATLAAGTALESAVEITESSGGVMAVHGEGRLTAMAALNAAGEVKKYALRKLFKESGRGEYEDKVKLRIAAADGKFLESALWVPIKIMNRREGVLFLFSTGTKRYLSVDLKIARVLAFQGALYARNLRFIDELGGKNVRLTEALRELAGTREELVRSERSAALGEVAGVIVHDLKNPMSGILGYAQLLEDGASILDSSRIREYASWIVRETRSLSRLTEEIVAFSNGMNSALSLREMKPIDLLSTALPFIESDLEGEDMSLSVTAQRDAGLVLVDSDKMERVFVNLAVNARQAMAPGGVLTISTRKREQWIEFSFCDTGCGVSDAIGETLFDPFVTAGNGRRLGLGLSISRWIVQAHGGDIFLSETGPEGTEMVLRLPLRHEGGKDPGGG